MFTWKFARTVFGNMSINGFSFDVEMLMLARQAGFRIKAVEVPWYNDGDSKVSPVADSLSMIRELFTIKRSLSKRAAEEYCLSMIGE